jgi:hypothetical protein
VVARHQGGENHAERIWALVNFEIWQRRFFDGEAINSQNDLCSIPGSDKTALLANQSRRVVRTSVPIG